MGQKVPSSNKLSLDKQLQRLPNLPIEFSCAQCIAFDKELIICGGNYNNRCYSYHIEKKKYQWICSYPQDIILTGHTVIVIPWMINNNNNNNEEREGKQSNNNNNGITLLSFGGDRIYCEYHTMIMHYQSVWDDTKDESILSSSSSSSASSSSSSSSSSSTTTTTLTSTSKSSTSSASSSHPYCPPSCSSSTASSSLSASKAKSTATATATATSKSSIAASPLLKYCNQWIPLPKYNVFGKEQGYDLGGARALIGGSNNHLLFITHNSNIIDVIDLHTFQYIQM